jgi:hypothetical protein
MEIKAKKAADFTVVPMRRDSCYGCYFSGRFVNQLPMCWELQSNTLVNEVFAHTGGSCFKRVAVLSNSNPKNNKLKIAPWGEKKVFTP